jgi:hypothetical protein
MIRGQRNYCSLIPLIDEYSDDLCIRALRQMPLRISEIGNAKGHNLSMEHRWAEGQYDRMSFFAAHLVRRQVGVTSAALAAASAKDNSHWGRAPTGESLRLLQLASAAKFTNRTPGCPTARTFDLVISSDSPVALGMFFRY